MREPLLLPLSALAAGILTAHSFYFNLGELFAPGIVAGIAAAAAFVFHAPRWARLASLVTAFVLAGLVTQVVHRQGRAPRLNAEDTETVLLAGCVTNPPVFSPGREQFTLNLASKAAARVSVTLKPGETLPLTYGQKVEVAAKIRSPRNYGNPDSFDYAGYLAAQHIYWTGTVSAPADVHALPGSCGFRPLGWIFAVRTWTLERLIRLYPGDLQTAALLQATLIGETSAVERRWTNDFRVTGTYHALVISGQHISVLAFTLLFFLKLFRVRRVPALTVATLASWLYAILSGLSAPVVRAAGGFTLFLVASYCFRKTRILNILAAVGLAYLIFDPDELFDPSFQLSFLSAAAIAVFAIPVMDRCTEPIRAAVKRFSQRAYDPQVIKSPSAAQWRVELRLVALTLRAWTGLSSRIAETVIAKAAQVGASVADAIIISACVQFGLALPMIMYFHRLSITGLSANIVVIPLLSLVVPLGFISIITGWYSLAFLTGLLLRGAESVAAWHVHFEPSWRMAALPLWISTAFAISLVALAFTIRHRRPFIAPALVSAAVLLGIICRQPWNPDVQPRFLEVTAIDVSQGDSLLIVFPNGQTMLVDAGGFPGAERMARKPQLDVGEDVVSPYLWSRRIRRLDYAALTHGHSDHMGGLPAVLDNFHPSVLWIGAEPDTPAWRAIREHAAADGTRITALTRASAPIDIGGTQIRTLAPSPEYSSGDTASNNDSLVLEIAYGRRSVLLTGDAERPVEEEMVSSGVLHPVTLLKVGHHGSKTSSSAEFLDQLKPRFAFDSDGFKNQFHHPHPDVLERLAVQHTAVFRTDERGLLTFRTDGDKVEVGTFH